MIKKPPVSSETNPGAMPGAAPHERTASVRIPSTRGHGTPAQVRVALRFLVGEDGEPLLTQPEARSMATSTWGRIDAVSLGEAQATLRMILINGRRRENEAWHIARAKRGASLTAAEKRRTEAVARRALQQRLFDLALSVAMWAQAITAVPSRYVSQVQRVWPVGEPEPARRAWKEFKAAFVPVPIAKGSALSRALLACRTRDGQINWDKLRDTVRDHRKG